MAQLPSGLADWSVRPVFKSNLTDFARCMMVLASRICWAFVRGVIGGGR